MLIFALKYKELHNLVWEKFDKIVTYWMKTKAGEERTSCKSDYWEFLTKFPGDAVSKELAEAGFRNIENIFRIS